MRVRGLRARKNHYSLETWRGAKYGIDVESDDAGLSPIWYPPSVNHRELFFQQLSQQRRPQVTDIAAFRQSWLENLQDLFDRIDVWLTPAKDQGISVDR
jgi:hypothetical protein